MSKDIEMNYKGGQEYEVIYPKTEDYLVINLLNSDTKQLLGLEDKATADEAFRTLYLKQVLNEKALITFNVQGNDGTPCAGIEIVGDNFCDADGNKEESVITNDSGIAQIFINNTSVNVNISQYADLQDYSNTINVEFGNQYEENIVLTRYNFRKYLSSQQCRFSKEVKRVDISLGGGGQPGFKGSNGLDSHSNSWSRGGKGGNGAIALIQENVSFQVNNLYSMQIASANGSSSFLGFNVQGATNSPGGQGGAGEYVLVTTVEEYGSSGGDGTTYVYDSFDTTTLYGGGGGGGKTMSLYSGPSTYIGGKNGGGTGGYRGNNSDVPTTNGEDGQAGTGGGGGGGTDEIGFAPPALPGNGGSGIVALRMYRD